MNKSKQTLGQFYTTNYEYILQNLSIPTNITTIIDPFAGQGDLLNFINNKTVECYDIDPKQSYIIQRDTLLDPPNYNNKFILTNPPYLARNKSKDKKIFDKYNQNDLYKCFIKDIITNKSLGGIIIIPLNFWCSIRQNDINLRKEFLQTYDVISLNIFEEKVFDDTSYTVCSFQFHNKSGNNNPIVCHILPSNIVITFTLNNNNNYTIGGDIYNLTQIFKLLD